MLVTLLVAVSGAAGQTQVIVMQLLQSPRQYDGRRLTVTGYYDSDWEWHLLFSDPRASKRGDFSRSIWIEADSVVESPSRRARITGIFMYSRHWRPHALFAGFGPFGNVPAQLYNCMVHLDK